MEKKIFFQTLFFNMHFRNISFKINNNFYFHHFDYHSSCILSGYVIRINKSGESLKMYIQIYVGTLFLDPSENFIRLWHHGTQRQNFWILEIVDHRRVNRFGSEPSPESVQKGDFAFVQGGSRSKIWQKLQWFRVLHISIWGVGTLFGGVGPPMPQWRRDCFA